MAKAAISEKSPDLYRLREPAGPSGDLNKAAHDERPGVQRRALIVLGPHRSGTSALTRVLSLSGATLPSHLLPAADGLPNDGNTQAGFWESKTLMLLHEEALASAGSRWDDPYDLPPTWFHSEVAEAFAHRLAEALTAEFGNAPIVVAKDPRISRVAPIWTAALEELGVEANWVIAVRNPLDVAASLNRRDGFPQPKGLLIWLTYFLAAERHTRHQRRMFVSFDDLLDDWRGVISQIGRGFGLSFSRQSHLSGAEIDGFLDLSLRHHATRTSEVAIRKDVSGWVKAAFQWALRAAAGESVNSKELDDIHHAFHQAETVFGPLLAQAENESQKRQANEFRLAREIGELKENLASREEGLVRIETELADLRQLAEERLNEITMLNIKKKELDRSRAKSRLSLHIAAEREDGLDKALVSLKGEMRCIRELLEEKHDRSQAKFSSLQTPGRGIPSSRVKAIAFYLPQYHPIPENDQWWGKGFTEWTNVTRAKPCFSGHQQPLLPSELGFYDLRVPEVRTQQAALAREHSITGFCYYYYWFTGRKILERPLEDMLASGEPDFPFCLCWANENWTRRWDGEDEAILLAQKHSPESDARFIDDVMPALLDPRYIKRNGEPLLLVYRADLLADPLRTTAVWREAACAAGLPGLHLCAVWKVEDPRPLGFDALVEFPPHHFTHKRITDEFEGATDDFEGEVFDYAAGVEAVKPLKEMIYPIYRGVMSGWDNTPRRGKKAWIFANGTAEVYGKWLEKVVRESAARRGEDDQFVFINAWNEWAEGATLEPSRMHGRSYLQATRSALETLIDSSTELGKLELRINYRLEKLDAELHESKSSLKAATERVDNVLSEHQSALHWLRHVDEDLAANHAILRSELADELSRIRHTVESAENRAAQILKLGIRVDGLQRLALARQTERPPRGMWLSLDHGILGLALKYPIWLLSGRLRRALRWWSQARRILRTGLFDSDYYKHRYPDVEASGIDPLYHYVRFGAEQGRDPNPFFSGSQYLAVFPKLVESNDNPLLHYLSQRTWDDERADGVAAMHESRDAPAPTPPSPIVPRIEWRMNPEHARTRNATSRRLLVVTHDAARAGAQLILLEILKHLADLEDLEIFLLLLQGGELEVEFQRYVHTLQFEELVSAQGFSRDEAIDAVLTDLSKHRPLMALCNTVASSEVAVACHRSGLPVLSLIYELPTTIESSLGRHKLLDILECSRRVVVASRFVKDALTKRYDIDPERLAPLHTGVFDWDQTADWRKRCRARVLEELHLPDDTFLVLGCGTVHHRKGTDLFVQLAREVLEMNANEKMFFLWVGADQVGPLFREWCEHDIQASGLHGRIRLAGARESTYDYFGAADAFALTSREDPFPMVSLEAMARGVPVVAFRDAGGAPEALADRAGVVVPYLDVKAMARSLICLSEAPNFHAEISQNARRKIEVHYQWRNYVRELVNFLERDFGYRSEHVVVSA